MVVESSLFGSQKLWFFLRLFSQAFLSLLLGISEEWGKPFRNGVYFTIMNVDSILQHSRQKVNLCEGGILAKKAGWDSGGCTFFCLIPPGGNYFFIFRQKVLPPLSHPAFYARIPPSRKLTFWRSCCVMES